MRLLSRRSIAGSRFQIEKVFTVTIEFCYGEVVVVHGAYGQFVLEKKYLAERTDHKRNVVDVYGI
jgi:hypothetical protein